MPTIPEILFGIKWKGLFLFLPAGIFGVTAGDGPEIPARIFRPKFAVPF